MSTLSKSTFARPLLLQEQLQERDIALFTPKEFSRLFGIPTNQTKYFLETYTKRGMFVRIKKGLYALKNNFPSEEIIANALYKPSYISLEYALSRYGLIPEMPYIVTSVTTKSTASFTVRGKEFSYAKIKNKAFTGYAPEKTGTRTIFIAEPEKALVDYLYFVSLGKKILNDRLDVSRINEKNVRDYAQLFGRKRLVALVNKLFFS